MGVAVLANLSPLGAWRPESAHTLANDSQEPVQTRLVFMVLGQGNLKKPASGVSLSRKRAPLPGLKMSHKTATQGINVARISQAESVHYEVAFVVLFWAPSHTNVQQSR